ncbi:MAG: glycogen debranching enzyme N-terminal domain-containing protein [Victivallales bacterium]|nr:glycogen debranching enzyme N-terminal domain-containing protein [Victivallales bacterium]
MAALVLEQRPAPHARLVRYTGDTLRVTLRLSQPQQGQAWLRTNLGNAALHRQEIVDYYEKGLARLGRDWHDLPMRRVNPTTYEILLPLTEIGLFDFKAYFTCEGGAQTLWPRGENARVKVVTALAAADNTIYNAFVRQFGPNLAAQQTPAHELLQQAASRLDDAQFTVIPPSGTFRQFAKHLDFIIRELGFRIIQFLPIHPTPTTFARMGRYGSPFAPLDFFDVDASMAEFDRVTTPLEQFREVIDQIHSRGAIVFLDLPIDHTGWASEFQSHHPEWFARNPDGSFQSPGAWGVVWADLCKLDFAQKALWKRLAEVFLHWCHHGVDGFRCDAGYMIPPPVWEYIIARVRQQFPATIFFLEGLGGGQEATTRLLEDAGMDWAYSELFQNYSAGDIARYLDFATRYSGTTGPLVNFAETHDNERLASHGAPWAKLRVSLNALFAPAGCFGIANGVEWLATEKIDVHGASSLNWGASENLVKPLAKLTSLLKTHPAFQANATCRVPVGAGGNAAGLLRVPHHHAEWTLLVVANPETGTPAAFEWNFQEFNPGATALDLLTGRLVNVALDQCQCHVHLNPAEVLCLALPNAPQLPRQRISAVQWQHLKATVLRCRNRHLGIQDLQGIDVDAEAKALHRNPTSFLKQLYGQENYLPLVEWSPEKDQNRLVCLPPGHYILVNHNAPFTAQLVTRDGCHEQFHALPRFDGRNFALFQPLPKTNTPQEAEIRINVFGRDGTHRRLAGKLLALPTIANQHVTLALTREKLTPNACALAANDLGGYALVAAEWGTVRSQYQALLAANQQPGFPVDRTVVFPRCRTWVIYRDFSQELGPHCQQDFAVIAKNTFRWSFAVPSGMGGNVYLQVIYHLDEKANAGQLAFTRLVPPPEQEEIFALDANEPVTLLVRPDVDDRSHHGATTASRGPEQEFPRRVATSKNAFAFRLESGNSLEMKILRGEFIPQAEWSYAQHRPLEAERGLHASNDLFSPGFFKSSLKRGESAVIAVRLAGSDDPSADTEMLPVPTKGASFRSLTLEDALREALEAFVVRRDPNKTVIAGYPWFLDWGRDTFICLRGLIAAGKRKDAFAIIRQFASFEDHGTIPNMLSGDNLANRDTSDAPLLLFPAVQDYLDAETPTPAAEILATDCGGRPLAEILKSIVDNYRAGTPNGIHVDPESALVFSPAHYTWMDTNYPAATPREGYPIEIQALWYFALQFLAKHGLGEEYAGLATRVKAAVAKFFPAGEHVGFSDCLHAVPGQTAHQAKADDACRPNQLYAITHGLVDDPKMRRKILDACAQLVVPGALRSLACQHVNYELPVMRDGQLLNDPANPYWGQYNGDEDTRRKPAYHNGTAWGFLLPLYCEALVVTYGDSAKKAAAALLGSTAILMTRECLGQLPEVLDGDFPHAPRGCCAQAWSVTETLRILLKLRQP